MNKPNESNVVNRAQLFEQRQIANARAAQRRDAMLERRRSAGYGLLGAIGVGGLIAAVTLLGGSPKHAGNEGAKDAETHAQPLTVGASIIPSGVTLRKTPAIEHKDTASGDSGNAYTTLSSKEKAVFANPVTVHENDADWLAGTVVKDGNKQRVFVDLTALQSQTDPTSATHQTYYDEIESFTGNPSHLATDTPNPTASFEGDSYVFTHNGHGTKVAKVTIVDASQADQFAVKQGFTKQ